MVRKLALLALLLSPAFASAQQVQTRTQPPAAADFNYSAPRIQQPEYLREPASPADRATSAFRACVNRGLPGLAPALSAEAGAARLRQACATPLQALQAAWETVIAESRLRPELRERARAEVRQWIASTEPRIAARIRQYRATTAALTR